MFVCKDKEVKVGDIEIFVFKFNENKIKRNEFEGFKKVKGF